MFGEEEKIKVALVNPPYPGGLVDYQVPCIGLAYITAVLEKNGYEVRVIDCPVLHINLKGLEQEITRFEPDIIGVTSVTATFQSALQAAHAIKETCPDVLVVLGGPHASFMDEEILRGNSDVDVVVRGEGEETMLDLVHCFSKDGLKGLHGVAGLSFRDGGQVVRTPNRPLIQNLDQLPYPAYKHFPLNKYRVSGRLIFPVVTSRGCPYQCTFCVASHMFGKTLRARSVGNVVDELEWLRDEYGADAYTFYDDIFTFDVERALKICEEIKNRKIGIPWDCQTRVDRVSPKILTKMREAGCELVSFGVESGSQKILDAMKKGTTVEQNEKAIKWAKQAGLSVSISVILGYPGETEETLKQTINFIKKTQPDDAFLCIATPYPGTELYNLVKSLGWRISREWSKYEMQTPVFENPHLPFAKITKEREIFYNQLYSPSYIIRQSLKGNIYSTLMAQTALHQLLWRIKIPWVSVIFKKIMRL